MLAERRQSGEASGRVFPGGVPGHHTFRSDLDAAGIRRVDDSGRKVDFHALRVTFITNLYRAGVPQRQAMALARHTDPRLTANIYTDQDALPLVEAVAKLPSYGLNATHEHAHGRTQDSFLSGPTVSPPVTTGEQAASSETTENTGVLNAVGCQNVTPDDTAKQWSRGESNPLTRLQALYRAKLMATDYSLRCFTP